MMIKDAVVHRLQNICQELGISVMALARAAGLTPSTVYSLLDSRRREVKLSTVKKLVDGIGLYRKGFTIIDFFNDPVFATLEQELQ